MGGFSVSASDVIPLILCVCVLGALLTKTVLFLGL